MYIHELEIEGIVEIVLEPFFDERGCFIRDFDKATFKEYGLPTDWVQENISFNEQKNIIRGLHFILPPYTDGKLIRCSRGKIWDVVVDLRKNSSTKGKHLFCELNESDYKWLHIPKGFAHGFCTLSDHSELIYKHDTFYRESHDSGIKWNDPDLSINWPTKKPLVSDKDNCLMNYCDFLEKYNGL